MFKHLKSQNIKNIVIFVCDSLRWDYTPASISNMGIAIKTVASSLYTASSFPSMISGLYTPKTGVHTWQDILPKNLRGLLDLDGYNTSLWCETTWTDLPPNKSSLHNILGDPEGISLKDIKTPFVYMEDDKGGHCPYGSPFGEKMGGSCDEFFREYGKKERKELTEQYKVGIKHSEKRFQERINILKERDLIKDTLIVFTSDHGELLGEYGGLTGHGRPPCPELVYVPTIFIHPSLKPENINNKIIRHVDLYPTIASILNKKISYELDGADLTWDMFPPIGLNFKFGGYFKTENKIKKLMLYKSSSAWDFHGGHIFHGLDKARALVFFFHRIRIQRHPEFRFMLENLKYNPSNKFKKYRSALHQLTSSYIRSMKPEISKINAQKIIENYMKESIGFQEKIKIKNSIFKLRRKGITIENSKST